MYANNNVTTTALVRPAITTESWYNNVNRYIDSHKKAESMWCVTCGRDLITNKLTMRCDRCGAKGSTK